MIELSIYQDDVIENNIKIPVYNFKSIYRVNIIGGESGTGKTRMFSCLEMALANQDGWSVVCNKPIVLINNISNIEEQLTNVSETIFICDEDIINVLLKRRLSDLVNKSKNYFIFIDRSLEAFIDTNVNALFEIRSTNKIYEGVEINEIVQYVDLRSSNNKIDSDEFDLIVMEDTETGKIFFTTLLDKLRPFGKKGGKSNVPINIEMALKQTNKKVLVALDYDSCLIEMLRITKNDNIDKSRVFFISMESFEEIICNTEFILQAFPEMRDKVLNYEKYLDASYKHTGKYFSDLLFKYVKVKSPIKQDGVRNATKFYEKNMSNFENCFINNCCYYKLDNCKLFTSVEKRKLLLCNKFECLRPFSTIYD